MLHSDWERHQRRDSWAPLDSFADFPFLCWTQPLFVHWGRGEDQKINLKDATPFSCLARLWKLFSLELPGQALSLLWGWFIWGGFVLCPFTQHIWILLKKNLWPLLDSTWVKGFNSMQDGAVLCSYTHGPLTSCINISWKFMRNLNFSGTTPDLLDQRPEYGWLAKMYPSHLRFSKCAKWFPNML
jgi:hypothetical protein